MNFEPEQTDDELLLRLRSGDRQAFTALYRRRQGAIYRYSLHMSNSPALAEDITQEVFLVLLRDQCGYDSARGTLAGYLLGIARKLLLKQTGRGVEISIDQEGDSQVAPQLAVNPDPLGDLTHREGLEALHRAVAALPPAYRDVVALCDIEDVAYADAAEALEIPVGTVRSRLHRARGLLADRLSQFCNTRRPVTSLKPARSLI
jgi:RNA polymerase sigma-70 factor (ECF subfamily)